MDGPGRLVRSGTAVGRFQIEPASGQQKGCRVRTLLPHCCQGSRGRGLLARLTQQTLAVKLEKRAESRCGESQVSIAND